MLDRSEYEEKLEEMLSDGTYKKLKKDPTAKFERLVGAALMQTEKGEMSKAK